LTSRMAAPDAGDAASLSHISPCGRTAARLPVPVDTHALGRARIRQMLEQEGMRGESCSGCTGKWRRHRASCSGRDGALVFFSRWGGSACGGVGAA
jgi:hypothetical protein